VTISFQFVAVIGCSVSGDNGVGTPQPSLKKKWFTSYTSSGEGTSGTPKSEAQLSSMRKWFTKYGKRSAKIRSPNKIKSPRKPREPREPKHKLECPDCGKAFNYPFDLKRHERSHTGQYLPLFSLLVL
jgi:uncharacterized Zn-finger protein